MLGVKKPFPRATHSEQLGVSLLHILSFLWLELIWAIKKYLGLVS